MEWLTSFWQNFYEATAAVGSVAFFFAVSALVLFMFLVAVAGALIPVLPGPVFAFLAILVLKFTIACETLSWWGVFICLVVTVISLLLDYVLPVKYTPTRAGAWGAFIGVFVGFVVGIVFPPAILPAIFLGPLSCAFALEYLSNASFKKAWQSGKGAFIGTVWSIAARVIAIFLMILVATLDILMF